MKKRIIAPIFVGCLFLAASMRVAEAAATTPPKVVFVGDWITYNWANIATTPNWTNDGLPGYFPWQGSSVDVLAAFQSDVVSLHPQIVHIMVGAGDESGNDDASRSYIMPGLLENLKAMVQEAKAANIKVILGLEPLTLGSINPMNALIAAYGGANNIPVINYADALCNCVSSSTATVPIGTDIFQQYGGGYYIIPPTNPLPPPDNYYLVVSPSGYSLMTAMVQNAIATMSLTLKGGWLQNVEAESEETSYKVIANVNSVGTQALIQFTPTGVYSDGSEHPLLNTSYGGSSGTWTSSNPLVMYITQTGLASALSAGTATISYTPPSGVKFSKWVMTVN